jgi:CBS domain-containing protein
MNDDEKTSPRNTILRRICFIQVGIITAATALLFVLMTREFGFFWHTFMLGGLGASIALQRNIAKKPEEKLEYLAGDRIAIAMPVVVGREVLGLFSYRTFSQAVIAHGRAATKNRKLDPLELTVDECMEPKPHFARVTDEFVEWFDVIDRSDSVLIGSPNRLQGIVTAMDILRYLYRVASPFVLIGEVELAIRALMQMAVDPVTLAACAHECLKDKYEAETMPTELQAMTFNDYIQIVGDGRRWGHFEPFFGGNRVRTRAKLEQLRDIRNVIFHFRREITVEEHQTLAANRDWMLRKARTADARQKEGQQ